MKVFAILVALAGIAVCIHAAPPNIGKCPFDSYNNNIRTCLTQFIKTLQQNPKDDCKVARESFVNCSAEAVSSCFSMTAEDTRKILEPQLSEDLMCKRAGLQYPNPSTINVTMPCTITGAEYLTKMNGCSDKIVKKWSANRADPTICSEFQDSKKCMKNVIDKYCQFKGEFQEVANYQFDDYNPFCANNKDPVNEVSSITISKAVIAISLVVATIQTF